MLSMLPLVSESRRAEVDTLRHALEARIGIVVAFAAPALAFASVANER